MTALAAVPLGAATSQQAAAWVSGTDAEMTLTPFVPKAYDETEPLPASETMALPWVSKPKPKPYGVTPAAIWAVPGVSSCVTQA